MKGAEKDPEESVNVTKRRLWTIEQVSEFLNIPKATLYAWRYKGDGPPGYRVGRHLRFDPEQVSQWLSSQSANR